MNSGLIDYFRQTQTLTISLFHLKDIFIKKKNTKLIDCKTYILVEMNIPQNLNNFIQPSSSSFWHYALTWTEPASHLQLLTENFLGKLPFLTLITVRIYQLICSSVQAEWCE